MTARARAFSLVLLCLAAAACGGGGAPGDLRTIGGTISGLTGSGLTLQLNGAQDLAISAGSTTFRFETLIAVGGTYEVTVSVPPSNPAQTCTVENGAGTITGADVTDVVVVCSAEAFHVGGTVTGLEGAGLVLRLNGESLPVAQSGGFTFPTGIASGAHWAVTVEQAPPGKGCDVEYGSGQIEGADVTNVVVACFPAASRVGGTVSGLGGGALVVQLGGESLRITQNGSFTFPTAIAKDTEYTIVVQAAPAPQRCTVQNERGTIARADVTNVVVTCTNHPANVWAVGKGGTLLHYTGSWAPVDSGTTHDLNAVWGASAYDVWAVGAAGTILHSDGNGWVDRGTGVTTRNLHGVWGSGPNDVWAVGDVGVIMRWDGSSWTFGRSGTYEDLLAVGGTSATDVWAVGARGTILRWNGTGWAQDPWPQTQSNAVNTWYTGVWAASAGDVWVVGYGYGDHGVSTGYVLHWTGTWSSERAGPLTAIWGSGANERWATGFQDLYTYAGEVCHWSGAEPSCLVPQPTLAFSQYSGVWGSGPSDVWAVGLDALHWTGDGWSTVPTGTNKMLNGVWGVAP